MKPQEFLSAMAETASKHDLELHMNLISKDVAVFGIPGFEEISYNDWFNQCKEEFANKVLKSVSYEGLKILEESPDRVMFQTVETIEGTDGFVKVNELVVVIQEEDDGQWRVVQERVLPEDEFIQSNI